MTRFGSSSNSALFWLLLCCLSLLSAPLDAQEQSPPEAIGDGAGTGTLVVVVEGVEGPPRDNILAYLDINRFADKPLPAETELRWLHANAERNIREALQPFGYYEPTIDSSLNRTASGWEARYRIQPGRALHIAMVDVRVLGEGAQDPVFQKLLSTLPMTKGQILEQPKYEQLKQNLETLATERGYFDARFAEHTIQIDLQAYEATIKLHYDTGKRYRFGDITFKQNILSPELLNRYPRFKSGDPYDANELLKLQGDLSGSPYFSQVQVNASPDTTTDTAPVDVELTPNKERKYSAGLGYGTDTGVRGKLKMEQRWINPQGHHYEAELQLSPIKSLIGFKYIIPGQNPTTDEYALTAGYTQQSDDQDYERIALGGSWQRQDGKWLKNYNLSFQYEDYQVGDEPRSTSLLLIPGLNWTWIDANDRLYATRGLLFGFELRGASTALLSDINFLQGVLHLKWVRALNTPEGGTHLLTQDTYLAVEAGLPVPHGFEMGPFSYYPDWEREKAERLGVMNRDMMIELLQTETNAPIAALSGYSLSIRSPEVQEVVRDDQLAFDEILATRFERVESVPHFGQAGTTLDLWRLKKEIPVWTPPAETPEE